MKVSVLCDEVAGDSSGFDDGAYGDIGEDDADEAAVAGEWGIKGVRELMVVLEAAESSVRVLCDGAL